MEKWQRIKYHPNLPLYEGQERVTGSKEHIELSRKAAGEGMVLLKNENSVLPLASGAKAALFGKGCIDYVKGGGGSGDVTVAYIRNLCEGMNIKANEGKVALYSPLEAFYRGEVEKQYAEGAVPGMTAEPAVPENLVKGAAAFTDTAIVTFCRFSGEGWDRKAILDEEGYELSDNEKHQIELSQRLFEDGDYYLTAAEKNLMETVKQNFNNIIVVLNVGGMVDSTWFKNDIAIDSVLMSWQAGMEGGLATADVLCGDVNPSGKLTDTFADSLEAYLSTDNFHESLSYVDYKDDVYVGYRYFETMAGAAGKVNYPFGFGISYTTFDMDEIKCEYTTDEVLLSVRVSNTGKKAGKEVVQVYYGAPQGKLGKPAKELVAFEKTRLLEAGDEQTIRFGIPFSMMASYDDLGAVCEAAYVLEAGEYQLYVGSSVEDVEKIENAFTIDEDIIVEQLSHQGAPYALKERLRADGTYEELPQRTKVEEPGLERQDTKLLEGILPESRYVGRSLYDDLLKVRVIRLEDVAKGEATLDDFMKQLSVDHLISLLGGQPNAGVANTFGMGNLSEYGVPNMMTADGPAGLRIHKECGVNTTAWPCATLLACTWNPDLLEKIGHAGAEEVRENGIGLWLTPGMNIHRSPLCGRNFEYYSEDPLLAGKMGAAMVRGIQSMHVGACPKHFACNNKETNRKGCDSRVSERALREIYLKAFEIVVKESAPFALMTSYNLINGVQASEHKELLTGILRDEWGFDGMVTTDWWTQGEHYRETKAGNDVKMANGFPERVKEAYEKGLISFEEIYVSARRILEMILKVD
ncbi:MAG: beta-glucosidase [Clostridia bacterium]|nr:beta-glucosidase [Clostridia bacterium]NCC43418.1 beta-glucosidase [Clostridia bacterium]